METYDWVRERNGDEKTESDGWTGEEREADIKSNELEPNARRKGLRNPPNKKGLRPRDHVVFLFWHPLSRKYNHKPVLRPLICLSAFLFLRLRDILSNTCAACSLTASAPASSASVNCCTQFIAARMMPTQM